MNVSYRRIKVVRLMLAPILGLGWTLALLALMGGRPISSAQVASAAPPGAQSHSQAHSESSLNLPLRFIANAGQTDPAVRFTAKGAGYTLFFAEDQVVFSASTAGADPPGHGLHRMPAPIPNPRPDTHPPSVVQLRFPGANSRPTVEGLNPMPGAVNFFLGNDPTRWRVNVPTYGAIVYRSLYPGVDLVYRGREGRLKSEFRLRPGADPAVIQMLYRGLTGVQLRQDGALVLETPLGELVEEAPLIYQEVDGVRHTIPGGYRLISPAPDATVSENDTYRIGFWVATYDPNRPLIIDPALSYASYLGGSSDDIGYGIAVDDNGHIYVVGHTESDDFPTRDAVDATYGGVADVFVTQIISAGGVYTYGYSTYLGGSDDDIGLAVVVDDAGGVYIAGRTSSSDFPTRNALDTSLGPWSDAFVTKIISVAGVYTLSYSTYLGGSNWDGGYALAVDDNGNAYVAGVTYSDDFPTRLAIQPNYTMGICAGDVLCGDVFVTQIISASGVYTYGYSTYLGGSGEDAAYGIAIGHAGETYVTGDTRSETGLSDFPIRNAVQPNYGGGGGDAFVTQIISSGGVYTYGYSTFLGGSSLDTATGIGLDNEGGVHLAGGTESHDFPTHRPIQPNYGGGPDDCFVAQIISASGVYTLGYSTYLGGSNDDVCEGIAVSADNEERVYVVGGTNSTDFPTRYAIQPDLGGNMDSFVTQIISASGVYTWGYFTYLGGSESEIAYAIATSPAGAEDVYVTGDTQSSDFPTRHAIQPIYRGLVDAFVVKISGGADLALSKSVTPTEAAMPGQTITYTLTYTNSGPISVGGVLITDIVPITLINVSATGHGAAITPTGSVSYVWQVAELAPGAGGVITITGIISPSLGGVFSLTNQAVIGVVSDTYYADENPLNDVAVVHNRVGHSGPTPNRVYLPAILRDYPNLRAQGQEIHRTRP